MKTFTAFSKFLMKTIPLLAFFVFAFNVKAQTIVKEQIQHKNERTANIDFEKLQKNEVSIHKIEQGNILPGEKQNRIEEASTTSNIEVTNETIDETINPKTDIKPERLEQVIIFNVLDEKGLAKEYVTHEERKIIEKKVKEYEKNKKIYDRAGKIYNISSKYEVVSVEKIK